MDSGKVVLGALAGLAAGAVLGILFAPDKGTNTRKKIAEKSKGSIDDLKQKYEDIISGLTSKLASAKGEAADLYQEGRNTANDTRAKVANQIK